jgi:hypothetical protein
MRPGTPHERKPTLRTPGHRLASPHETEAPRKGDLAGVIRRIKAQAREGPAQIVGVSQSPVSRSSTVSAPNLRLVAQNDIQQ